MAKPVTRLRGRTLLTDPEVFHPVYFLSTPVFLEYLSDYLSTITVAGKRLLDMGTGSGMVGIFAASRGARVTACDINPRAVALAGENARRNRVEMEVLPSDLFSALPGRQFDVICFNLPFLAGTPRSVFELALYGGGDFETVRAFAHGCREALAPGGTVAVIYSEDSGPERIVSCFADAGLVTTDERTAYRFFERFHLLRLQQPSAAPAEQHR
jgi:release factor glutamine methyltransferase